MYKSKRTIRFSLALIVILLCTMVISWGIVLAGETSLQWENSKHRAQVQIYNSKDKRTYTLNYDLSRTKEGQKKTIYIEYKDEKGRTHTLGSTDAIIRNSKVVANVKDLAKLIGVATIAENSTSIVVDMPKAPVKPEPKPGTGNAELGILSAKYELI